MKPLKVMVVPLALVALCAGGLAALSMHEGDEPVGHAVCFISPSTSCTTYTAQDEDGETVYQSGPFLVSPLTGSAGLPQAGQPLPPEVRVVTLTVQNYGKRPDVMTWTR